ncbi:MAG TPA: MBOAT family O-acyltransferase [Sedimentisphaerales bacterium]|nr:MBOAT family protein [Phycisphaerae bacterium]HON92545.1 MBOAT family O-acyltransferase [Sedimentisphaerales bacterium]HQI28182.1 MBOAT family O-acyltransferase [Sedimentisphaerales bacterium]
MLFQTPLFLIFFAVVYSVYLLIKGTRLRLPWLLVSSYVFYAWLSPLYLIPLAYATVVDYFVAGRIEAGSRKRAWLTLSIANNLLVLGYFKYASFFAENVNALLSAMRTPYEIPVPSLLLPAGLSFFLLQSIGYTIDVYRGTTKREKSFLAYATFVSFFPRLLAGPIERANHLLPQLHGAGRVTLRDFTDGLSIFVVGYFKKVALADYLAIYVASVYGSPQQQQSPALLLATFLFAWQIYFDFSGYTDMARGVARMMGIGLMLNFDNPYLAVSMGDFWKRWHISLSSWFRDYVYIPLGGNRKGKFATYRNLFLTMVLSGLWHGAAWTFVLWGAVHALGNFATRELERTPFYVRRLPTIVKQLFVLAMVTFAWIFFRAASIGDAWTIVTRIFTSGLSDPKCPVLVVVLIAAVWIYQYLFESRLRSILEIRIVRIVLMILLLTYLVLTVPAEGQPFIYMQF